MDILLFLCFLLSSIVLIKLIFFRKKENGIKLLLIFGISIGLITLGFENYFNRSCFGASTPVEIQTQNKTSQKLKVYAIAFWDNPWNCDGNYVHYDKEVKPNETSSFTIENDGGKFWIVAKNRKNEIIFLEDITKSENSYSFNIVDNEIFEKQKAKIAQELTFKTDQEEKMRKNLIWVNLGLIGFLIYTLRKTAGNSRQLRQQG